MITSFRVILDACTLVPITLCDTLLFLADRRLYMPGWSSEILDEVERNAARLIAQSGASADEAATAAAHRRKVMEHAFPDAAVYGYQALIPVMTNDEKDRHVLAAAVRANADIIVTANTKDFPRSATELYNIEIKTPDEFLMDLLGFDKRLVLESIKDMTAQKQRPPMTELDMLKRIGKNAPNFAAAALTLLES